MHSLSCSEERTGPEVGLYLISASPSVDVVASFVGALTLFYHSHWRGLQGESVAKADIEMLRQYPPSCNTLVTLN